MTNPPESRLFERDACADCGTRRGAPPYQGQCTNAWHRLAAPAAAKLHDAGCCLCGAHAAHFSLTRGEHAGAKWCGKCEDLYPTIGQLRAEITRRKSLPAPVECYGVQPSELPATLPAGTRWIDSPEFSNRRGEALEVVRLDRRTGVYCGAFSAVDNGRGVHASYIDWASTPKPSPQPERGEEIPALRCAACSKGLDGFASYTIVRDGKRAPGQYCQKCYERKERLARGEQPVPARCGAHAGGSMDRCALTEGHAGDHESDAVTPSQPSAGRGVYVCPRTGETYDLSAHGIPAEQTKPTCLDCGGATNSLFAGVCAYCVRRGTSPNERGAPQLDPAGASNLDARIASRARTEKDEEKREAWEAWETPGWDGVG